MPGDLQIRVLPAHTFFKRAKGLLGTKAWPAGLALWLKPCKQVHTMGMRYALDVVFLDERLRIVGMHKL